VRRVRPVLVIEQELALEGLGFLGERLEASGLPYRRLQLWREDLGGLRARDFSAIVPLGGNAHAWQESDYPFLRRERLLLADALEEGAPVLGICLGAQLLARALGAEVRTAEAPEIGWLPIAPTAEARNDPLFGHLTAPTGVYQWHHDVFELPAGARLLATSERFENQAFRAGDAWGVQFHPEVDPETFEVWIANHPGAAEANGIDEETLRESVWREAEASRPFRARLFDAFFELVAG
jgi:GMP synthase (glutamine-hydrolysing)